MMHPCSLTYLELMLAKVACFSATDPPSTDFCVLLPSPQTCLPLSLSSPSDQESFSPSPSPLPLPAMTTMYGSVRKIVTIKVC